MVIKKWYDSPMPKFSDLVGKTCTKVEKIGDEYLVFTLTDGKKFALYHSQDCCESVTIDSIVGDLDDLIGTPLLVAEEVTNSDQRPDGWEPDPDADSFTWTFYKLATIKGYVDVRWYGESNGYYSESVDFGEVE